MLIELMHDGFVIGSVDHQADIFIIILNDINLEGFLRILIPVCLELDIRACSAFQGLDKLVGINRCIEAKIDIAPIIFLLISS